jgi:hypothetical protein
VDPMGTLSGVTTGSSRTATRRTSRRCCELGVSRIRGALV